MDYAAKFHNGPMESLEVAIMTLISIGKMCKNPEVPPPKRIPLIKIYFVHIHIPRNNAVNCHNSPMDNLGEVADKAPLYMYV